VRICVICQNVELQYACFRGIHPFFDVSVLFPLQLVTPGNFDWSDLSQNHPKMFVFNDLVSSGKV